MPPLVSLASRTLLLALLLCWAAPSLAGTKLDLSPYLGGVGTPGDFKVFARSTGGERKVTLLQLEPWKKGWKGVFFEEVTGAGDSDGTVQAEGYLIPGKQLLNGSEFYSNGLAIFLKKPAKGLKLQIKPGQVQRIKQKARLLLDGIDVASARLSREWLVDGFETVTTPSGTYDDALRAQSRSVITLENRQVKLVQLNEQTLWYAAGWGLVRKETAFEIYENGVFVESDAWTEELSSGSFGGVPFP